MKREDIPAGLRAGDGSCDGCHEFPIVFVSVPLSPSPGNVGMAEALAGLSEAPELNEIRALVGFAGVSAMGSSRAWSYVHRMIKKARRSYRHIAPVVLGLALIASACGSDDITFDDVAVGSSSVVDAADVSFVEISPFARFGPAQGDFSTGEHGTFGIFGAGQASPAHTHSGAYYAVVLEGGEMNNPFGTESDPVTLPAGSFWSVPGDAEHITACLNPDEECRFFFHSSGAFDFFPLDALTVDRDPAAQSIPSGELVFDDLEPYDGAALLWGSQDSGPHGTIVRIDAGSNTGELAHRAAFTAVPAVGSLTIDDGSSTTAITVGSVVEMEANTPHSLSCAAGTDCLVYLFSDRPLDIRN